MNSSRFLGGQLPSNPFTETLAAALPAGFTVCPHAFVSSWTPEELQERQRLYEAAYRKAQRMAAFLPDERVAFP